MDKAFPSLNKLYLNEENHAQFSNCFLNGISDGLIYNGWLCSLSWSLDCSFSVKTMNFDDELWHLIHDPLFSQINLALHSDYQYTLTVMLQNVFTIHHCG